MSNTRSFCTVITGLLVLGLVVQAQETRTPSVDYPNYKIPSTSFSCSEQKYIPGLYADMETDCQVFHFCDENLQESFSCPSGMTFNQASLTCDLWENSNCSLTPQFLSVNSRPEMENARRNILMVLQLKKSRNRPSVRPSDVFEKITSLYDSTLGEDQSKSPDLAAVDVNAKSNISPEVSSQETFEEGSEENESLFIKELSGLDENVLNDEFTDIAEIHGSEDMEPALFYDTVTEKYYVDYDSSKMVKVPEDTVDQYKNFYNYGGLGKRYSLAYSDYADEIQTDSEQDDSKERSNGLEEFNEILATAKTNEKELLRRLLDTEQPKRSRRRPLYTVVQEDEDRILGADRGVQYSIVDSADNPFTTESVLTGTGLNFEFFDEIASERNEEPQKVGYKVPYEISDLNNPNIASLANPEEPQTSEFEQAIVSELAFPKIGDHGLGRPLPSEEKQSEESLQNDAQDYQTSDEYSFIENLSSDDYESYSTDYSGVDTEIVKKPDSDQENRYQGEYLPSVESDDTYVVIPDEYDTALGQHSETNGLTETYGAQSDAIDSYDAWRSFVPSYDSPVAVPSYVSPVAYTPVGPYWISMPQYHFPNVYGSQEPYSSEDFLNPDLLKSPEDAESEITNDQAYRYDYAAISPERYFPFADAGHYAYESPTNYPEYVYDYGTEYGYPYAKVYGNPNIGNFGYDASEVTVAAESLNLNENPGIKIAGNDYSESEIHSWDSSYLTESSDIEVAESTVPDEALADMYVTSRTNGDSNEMPSVDEQPETFYLFDFEDDKEEIKPDITDGLPDTDQLGPNELFQAEEPSRRNESFDADVEGSNVSSESESTGTLLATSRDFDGVNSKPLDGSETAEDTRNEDSVSLPTSESSVLNIPKAQRPRQPRLYASNMNLQRDPKFLQKKMYPESNFNLKDVTDQSYHAEDISGMEDGFSHRTGNAGSSRVSKFSEIQKRILSLKENKLGPLSKYINSAGKKN